MSNPVREKKRSPNRLVVDESTGEGDNSCILLSEAKMEGMHAPIYTRIPLIVSCVVKFNLFLILLDPQSVSVSNFLPIDLV